MKRKIFVDSDVILSSLISNKGAAYFLLNEADLNLSISKSLIQELERGVNKLNLDKNQLINLVRKRLKIVKFIKKSDEIKKEFKNYVFDEDDAHIVAGARKAKAKLILSYNIKDFNTPKLKEDFNIKVQTPAQFLQYLRSQN